MRPELRPYQEESAKKLTDILMNRGMCALDASDCGTGKTFVALETAGRVGQPVAVVCPKSVIPAWGAACRLFGVSPVFVHNYEKLRAGNTNFICKKGKTFYWNLPYLTTIIFDEVHKCKAHNSQNSAMLFAALKGDFRVLGLSATVASSPLDLKVLGYGLGLHRFNDYWQWAFKNGVRKNHWGQFVYYGKPEMLERIHKQIFPDRGVRVRIPDLGDLFPENTVIAEAYDTGKTEEIASAYREVYDKLNALETLEKKAAGMRGVEFLRARQVAEMAKIPVIIELVEELKDEGKSVVIFTNFRESLAQLAKELDTKCIIWGEQKPEEREKNLNDFQSNKEQVILCQIQAGGSGISLHDTDGKHPRVSIIPPTFSAIDLRQALGRIHRLGGSSKCLQYIVFAAGTVEENVCKRMQQKISNLDTLNDSDLL